MSDNYLQIDPNEFAMQVIATSHADTNLSNSALIKKNLTRTIFVEVKILLL